MTNHAVDSELFRTMPFFQSLSHDCAAKLAAIATLRSDPSRTVLFREDTLFENLMIVVTGLVALDMEVPRRGKIRMLTVGPGEILAWSAVLGDRRMKATATVIEDSQLLAIPADRLDELCSANHDCGYSIMRRLAVSVSQRLLATRLQLLDLFSETRSDPIASSSNS